MSEYEELEATLRRWTNVGGDPAPYDFVGMFHLFRACVQNMMEHSMDADWADIDDGLSEAEKEFLRRMAK